MKIERAALIVIDMQNAFLEKESPLCIQQASDTVPTCGSVIAGAREQEIPVFFVNRTYRKNGSDVEFTRYDSWERGGRYLAPGSEGILSVGVPSEFVPNIGDYTLIKPRYSAFFQTSLDLMLRRLQIDTVVLIGTTTPNCIRTTCYDAISMDYNVVIVSDCTSSNTEEIQRVNLADMAGVGSKIITSEAFLAGEVFNLDNIARYVSDQTKGDKTPPE